MNQQERPDERDIIKNQIDWIKSGKIGCVFASALVQKHNEIGWIFIVNQEKLEIPKSAFLLSIIFPDSNVQAVQKWALGNGMYLENIDKLYQGLRIKVGTDISWVQYFGKDSHVKTRQSPYPMLSFAVKLPPTYYVKVGFNGILHLAHASVENLSKRVADALWVNSIAKTKRELGYSPTIREAAKTTFVK